jgi:hypothetical protein
MTADTRLTQYARGRGGLCKIPPETSRRPAAPAPPARIPQR